MSLPRTRSKGPIGSSSVVHPQSNRCSMQLEAPPSTSTFAATDRRISSNSLGASGPPSVRQTEAPSPAAYRPHTPVPAPNSSTAAPCIVAVDLVIHRHRTGAAGQIIPPRHTSDADSAGGCRHTFSDTPEGSGGTIATPSIRFGALGHVCASQTWSENTVDTV